MTAINLVLLLLAVGAWFIAAKEFRLPTKVESAINKRQRKNTSSFPLYKTLEHHSPYELKVYRDLRWLHSSSDASQRTRFIIYRFKAHANDDSEKIITCLSRSFPNVGFVNSHELQRTDKDT